MESKIWDVSINPYKVISYMKKKCFKILVKKLFIQKKLLEKVDKLRKV